MKIVFMGTPDFAAAILKSLFDAGFTLLASVCQPDRPAGRSHSVPKPCEVKLLSKALGIPVLQPPDPADKDFIEEIRKLNPDAIVVAAYGRILKGELLKVPRLGAVNVHASILPRWRGAAPIEWSIIAGDRESGVSTMLMDEGLDTGDILLSEAVAIADDDDALSLKAKLQAVGGKLIVRTLNELDAGTLSPHPQEESLACYAPKLKRETGLIDFGMSADSIDRLVRGLYPRPGAYCYMGKRTIKILKARAIGGEDLPHKAPGELIGDKSRLIVAAGDGALEVLRLKIEGKGEMSAAEFLRGHSPVGFMGKRSE